MRCSCFTAVCVVGWARLFTCWASESKKTPSAHSSRQPLPCRTAFIPKGTSAVGCRVRLLRRIGLPHDTVSLFSSSSGSSDSPDIAFAVDAASPRLTLMSCTSSFTAFSGPVQRGEVLDWMDDDGARKLSSLVHRASIGAASGSAHVVFNVPHSRCAGKFRARCSAHLYAQDSVDGKVCVRVTLSNVQVRVGRRRVSQQHRDSTTRGAAAVTVGHSRRC